MGSSRNPLDKWKWTMTMMMMMMMMRGQETPFPTPLTISGKMIWDFKIQRRGRQRERKKNNWFN